MGSLKLRIYRTKQRLIRTVKRLRLHLKDRVVFKSPSDKKVFYDLYYGKTNGNGLKEIGIKTAGSTPIFIRDNSVDHSVVRSTFFSLYHLPPVKLGTNALIVDLGANIGLTMRHLKYLYPDAKIIGVEIDCENYLLAKKNLGGFDNCFLINAAIWHKDGFVHYTGNDAQSFYCTGDALNSTNSVKSYSLTTLFEEYNLSSIDFVKMDIEGAESSIFESDCTWLRAVKSINIEVHNNSLNRYIGVLKEFGFKCKISKRHWSAVLAYK